MINPDVMRRLLKVFALAKAGAAGEKQAAEQQLASMLKKFGISEDELNDITAPARQYQFKYRSDFEQRLLRQTVAKVCGSNSFKCYFVVGKRNTAIFDLTPSQYSEITIAFSVYKKSMSEEMDLCFKAFVQANRIFSMSESSDENTEVSLLEAQQARKIILRAELMEKSKLYRALEST